MREAGELDGVIDLGEVCRAGDIPFVVEACAAVARGEADALLCRNIGQVDAACEAAVAWEVAPPLNVWNAQTARVLQGLGARRIWLPEELSDENVVGVQNAARLAGVSVPVARVASGSTPLMVMEHCVLTAEGPAMVHARRVPGAWRASAAIAFWWSSTEMPPMPVLRCAWTSGGGRGCTAEGGSALH